MYSHCSWQYVQDKGGIIFTARDLRGCDGVHGLRHVLSQIKDRIGNLPVYLTLDIDCLDPAFAPGTGTPEPGGLTSSQVLTILEELALELEETAERKLRGEGTRVSIETLPETFPTTPGI